mmetsp:Transcript_5610/g.19740  ORF Transcript_5610/g.19740 Transcript_5610/m.19740 type:complete len:289 (-) Transcript_5610:1106-1972(-)
MLRSPPSSLERVRNALSGVFESNIDGASIKLLVCLVAKLRSQRISHSRPPRYEIVIELSLARTKTDRRSIPHVRQLLGFYLVGLQRRERALAGYCRLACELRDIPEALQASPGDLVGGVQLDYLLVILESLLQVPLQVRGRRPMEIVVVDLREILDGVGELSLCLHVHPSIKVGEPAGIEEGAEPDPDVLVLRVEVVRSQIVLEGKADFLQLSIAVTSVHLASVSPRKAARPRASHPHTRGCGIVLQSEVVHRQRPLQVPSCVELDGLPQEIQRHCGSAGEAHDTSWL